MSDIEKALRAIMLWRLNVNTSPNQIMGGLDHEGIAVALFNGPIWDEADRALSRAAAPPYPFCRTPDKCAGKGYCRNDPACND